MGIQDRKWVLFSIWDKTSTDDNPNASPDDLVKVLAHGEGVTVRRFGGEGTGGQLKFPGLRTEGGSHISTHGQRSTRRAGN